MKSGVWKHFSMVRSPNRELTPLKSASFEIRISSFVHPSKRHRLGWGKISHPLLNEGKYIREYSKIRPIEYILFKSFQCPLESRLIVEYSRMHVPSLSSGCEMAPFFVRHAALKCLPDLPKSSFGWGKFQGPLLNDAHCGEHKSRK